MKISRIVVTAAASLAGAAWIAPPRIVHGAPPALPPVHAAARRTLRPFGSEAELRAWLRELARRQARVSRLEYDEAAPLAAGDAAGTAQAAESVTNVQQAGVDEGGIVKVHGDHLVILRRGRLFTVAIGDGQLRPVSQVDAFGPGVDPAGAWYDEMLVSGDQVIVIGYSYQRGGTEIGRFAVDAAGHLSHRDTWHLRSNDYYSSRNYASRLIGTRLIFYTPLYLSPSVADPFAGMPALRRWHPGATDAEFHRLAPATGIYRPAHPLGDEETVALHTVTTCELSTPELECRATGVLGPAGRVFYVSEGSVYVWTTGAGGGEGEQRAASTLYRIPLNGAAPTALGVTGSPVDQFSFLESDDAMLNVLVRADGAGDGMWAAERGGGSAALLRVPLAAFADGTAPAPASAYRALPATDDPRGYGADAFHNRFVGDYLLYGSGSGWGNPSAEGDGTLIAVPWRGGPARRLAIGHSVDRIEPMGGEAVVIGTRGGDLHFTAVRLEGQPALAQHFVRAGASQGELRSHGFFYRAEGAGRGMLGLPIRGAAAPGYEHLFSSSAGILFLAAGPESFTPMGELASDPRSASDDACVASCVDWYGNARPLFVRGRVLALLGYELVEGSLRDGRLREVRRVSFAPAQRSASR
jgi:hypothetical protein